MCSRMRGEHVFKKFESKLRTNGRTNERTNICHGCKWTNQHAKREARPPDSGLSMRPLGAATFYWLSTACPIACAHGCNLTLVPANNLRHSQQKLKAERARTDEQNFFGVERRTDGRTSGELTNGRTNERIRIQTTHEQTDERTNERWMTEECGCAWC